MKTSRMVCGAVTALAIALLVPPATAAEKESRKCRKEIGAKLSKVVSAGLAVVEACHKSRDKGKLAGNCNDRAIADVKGKIAKAEASATKAITKKCLPGDLVLGNYPQGDPDGTFFPISEDAVEQTGAAVLGAPAIVGDKPKVKCHAEIAKAGKKIVEEILKGAVKCQNAADKAATTFGELAAACVATPIKSGPKGESAIAKKCTGLAGADVGSCDPLPGCVTAVATAAGQNLAAAIYGEPTISCGNTLTEAGEECDDGNQLTTDGCIDCKLATCGDGFVHAGVELCGDAPADACANPSAATCQVTPCTTNGGTRTVAVRFAKPASQSVTGLVIALDYPETKVQIPGTGDAQSVLDRVTIAPQGLPATADRDFEVQVTIAGFAPIAAGEFFSAVFDECATPTVDEFGCRVVSASNDQGGDITNLVTCSVVLP